MTSTLLERLEIAAGELLAHNRQLEKECQRLKQQKIGWQQERQELLRQVEVALKRFEALTPEDC